MYMYVLIIIDMSIHACIFYICLYIHICMCFIHICTYICIGVYILFTLKSSLCGESASWTEYSFGLDRSGIELWLCSIQVLMYLG